MTKKNTKASKTEVMEVPDTSPIQVTEVVEDAPKVEKSYSVSEVDPESGLRVRRYISNDSELKPAVRTPMRPQRIVKARSIYSNPAMLDFPTDKLGIMSGLKKEMLKIASKIGTDPRNIETLENTLDLLMKHVRARAEENQGGAGFKTRGA